MSKKGAHPLLAQFITIVTPATAFVEQAAQVQRQHQWLLDLAHLLNPPEATPEYSSVAVAQSLDDYLVKLHAQVADAADEADYAAATHIEQTLRNLWWGLFTCYDVPDLPRTNNELERFLRQLKMGQRRISGRQNVHSFIIRYGRYAAYLDFQESQPELLRRLQQVPQADFLAERQQLNAALLREQKRHRFQHHQRDYLQALEARWVTAVEKTAAPENSQ